jgi:ABC-type lipoprotein release transport system permease subunit
MNAADLVAMSGSNLLRQKGRAVLTAAGVVIGVSALVLMVSLGLGLQREFLQLFQTDYEMGTLTVMRAKSDVPRKKGRGFTPFSFGGQPIPVTDRDLEEMAKVPGVARALPDLQMYLRVSIDLPGEVQGVDFHPVTGVVPEEEPGFAAALVKGAMWTSRTEKVCLIPTAFLDFRVGLKPEEVVGKKVTFASIMQEDESEPPSEDAYTIVGVFKTEKFGFRGRQIVLPMDQALDLRARKGGNPFLPSKKGTYIAAEVRLADPRRADEVAGRLRGLGYQVTSANDRIRMVNVFILVLEAFLASMGAIGLVVSLFGIANTMAMAVLERTREIGIMKALGARNRDIGRLFLAEAATIGAVSGVAGLAGAFLAGKLLNAIARGAFDLPPEVTLFHVPWWLAAGSVLFSMFVSVFAGTLPARRAARMDPVKSLRYE